MKPYSTFQPDEGARCPPSISARASSSARRRDVPGARTLAGSSPSRMKGSPAQASARRASAIKPSVASDAVVGCSLISCMDAASESAALVRKGDPANPQGGRRAPSISVGRMREGSPRRVTRGLVQTARRAKPDGPLCGAAEATPRRRKAVGRFPRRSERLGAESPEYGKGVLGLDLVDQLASGLDLAVDPSGELEGLVAGSRARDHVGEGA